MDELVQDVRFALRSLRKQPGFVVAALVTLGVGIGANVAMFSVANLALFRALPFPEADRLVLGRTVWPGGNIAPSRETSRSPARASRSAFREPGYPPDSSGPWGFPRCWDGNSFLRRVSPAGRKWS
jgi:hypothetical protein